MPDRLICKVRDFGTYFATRDLGRTVRAAAIDMLATSADLDSIVLDFDGVEAITNGCADEMVAGLITRQDDRRIFVRGANSEVWDAIITALTRRGLTIEREDDRRG